MDRFFHNELEGMRSNLVLMGRKTVDNLRLAVQALIENDLSLVDEVIKADDEVDDLNIAIDNDAIRYISLRSPVARDVRLLTVAMKCSRELERSCDEAVAIAKRARVIAKSNPMLNSYQVPRMADLSIKMLDDAIDSFIQENSEQARELPKRDKEVDTLHRSNYEQLNDLILNDPEISASAVGLMFISKSLERIGDHAVNIGEEVVYLLEGSDIRHTSEVKRSQM